VYKITDYSDVSKGFVTQSNGSTYSYDADGNMTADPNKGITGITYNHLNLPTQITFTGNRTITFLYDAGGNKLRKTVNNNGTVLYTQDYVNGIEYKNGALEAIYHSEGRVTNIDGALKYEYAMKDHLGNTRLMFCDRNGDGVIKPENAPEASEVTQENSYYAFGMNMEFGAWENTPSVTDNLKQYNGKELNTDFGLNWNDYGARFYDPAVARWNSIDPMAEKYMSYNPYNYVMNNPTKFIDPNGMEVIIKYKDENNKAQSYTYKYEKDRKMDDKTKGSFLGKTITALDKIASGGKNGNELVQGLVNKGTTNIQETSGKNTTEYGENQATINFNADSEQKVPTLNAEGSTTMQSSETFVALAHELGHSEDHQDGTPVDLLQNFWEKEVNGKKYSVANTELKSTHRENQVRAEHNMNLRSEYGRTQSGVQIPGQELINPKTRESLYFNNNGNTNYKKVTENPYKY